MEPLYKNLNIASYSELFGLEGRFICALCKSSRKFFCYKCCVVNPEFESIVPKIQLPVKVDIIKHYQEVIGKSTSPHAKIIAPDDASIYIYPDIPDYSQEEGEVVLVFPSSKSVSISSLFKGSKIDYKKNHGLTHGYSIPTMLTRNLDEVISKEESDDDQPTKQYSLDNLPFKRVVFIDSTWKQSRSIYKDPRISSMKSCVIQNRVTKFWRHQKGSPDWYLSTIEAIHSFLLEFHINAFGISKKYYEEMLGDLELDATFISPSQIITDESDSDADSLCTPYKGQYDNILFFFAFFHTLINTLENKNRRVSKTE